MVYNWAVHSLLLLCFFATSFAQFKNESNKIDTFEILKRDLSGYLRKKNASQQNKLLDSLISKNDFSIKNGVLLLEKGKNLISLDSLEKGKNILNSALNIFHSNNSIKGRAYCHYYLGKTACLLNVPEDVISNYNTASKLFQNCNYHDGVILCHNKIGTYFSKIGNNVIANDHFEQAKFFFSHSNNEKIKAAVLINQAALLFSKNRKDSALVLYKEVEEKYYNYLTDSKFSILYNNLAGIYLQKKEWEKAYNYVNKSLFIKTKLQDSVGIINSQINLFYLSNNIKDVKRSKEYFELISPIFENSNYDSEISLGFLYNTIQHKILLGDVYQLPKLINTYVDNRDSLTNLAFSDKLIEMQKSFELQEKDREIELLQKEDALQKAQLTNQKLLTLSVSVLALLLVGIGVLVNRQRRRLKKSQHILKQRKQEIILVNEELQRTNLSKDRILAVIGHDLRGPVGGLKELIELYMELGEFEPEDFHNLLSAARESSTSTYHLLENLLSWANSQRGQIMFEPETTLIKDMICHTVELLDKAVNTRGIRFKCDVPEGLQLTVDKNMLNTIVRNLVSNAIKFSPEKSLITITATEQAEEVILCIADEGIGFSAKESENLFTHKEAYFLENGNSAKGTGLGLILCKEFVERHGGRIWTESDLKKGAKVCFSIPKELQELTPMEEAPVKKSRKKWRAWSNLF